MSRAITDTGGAPILYINLQLAANNDSVVVVGRVPCEAGLYLTASPVNASASVKARRTGSGDAFQDLATSPIDLTPYAGTVVSFDFKVHSSNVTGFARVALPVRVSFTP
jgi:hypothetical protein